MKVRVCVLPIVLMVLGSVLCSPAWGVSITTTNLPMATEMVPYSYPMRVAGGVPPYTWTSFLPFPLGLSMDASGMISGTPLRQGANQIWIVVRDSLGAEAGRQFRLVVEANPNRPPELLGRTPSDDQWTVGESTASTFSVTATDPESQPLAYRWTWNGGSVGTDSNVFSLATEWNDPRSGGLLICWISDGLWTSRTFAAWQVSISKDNDQDGMPNSYELSYPGALNPDDPTDAMGDADGDKWANLYEYYNQTSPVDADSDDDSLSDGWEATYGTQPLSSTGLIRDVDLIWRGAFYAAGEAVDVVVQSNVAYVAWGDAGLRAIQVANPAAPVDLGAMDTPGYANGVAVGGGRAYVADEWGGFHIATAVAGTPALLGSYADAYYVQDVALQGARAYVADGYYGLKVLACSNPAAITMEGQYDTGGYSAGIILRSNTVTVADYWGGLLSMDVSVPGFPNQVAWQGGNATEIAREGDYAFVADNNQIRVVQIANPNDLTNTSIFNLGVPVQNLCASNRYVYAACAWAGLRVLDVLDPAHPRQVGAYPLGGYTRGVYVVGNRVFLADGYNGLQILETMPRDLDVDGMMDNWEMYSFGSLAQTPSGDFDGDGISNRGEYNEGLDPAAADQDADGVLDGAEVHVYFCDPRVADTDGDGLSDGQEVQALTGYTTNPANPDTDGDGAADAWEINHGFDPTNPADGSQDADGDWLANAEEYRAGTDPRQADTDGDSLGDGWEVSHSLDPLAAAEPVSGADIRLAASVDTPGFAQSVTVASNLIYVADGLRGLSVIEEGDSGALVNLLPTGFLHGPGAAWDVAVASNMAYLANGRAGLRVIDVTDPSNPVRRGSFGVGYGYGYGVAVRGAEVFAAMGLDGLRRVNVANPDVPAEVGFLGTPGEARGIDLSGDYVYVDDAWMGLQIASVSNAGSPSLLGSADTPGDALASCLVSNFVYVADQGNGLVVVDVADKAHPQIATELTFGYGYGFGGMARDVVCAGAFAYLADGFFGVHVIDVRDPGEPVWVGRVQPEGFAAGVCARSNKLYIASGLAGVWVYENHGLWDMDADGLPDAWEVEKFGSLDRNASGDEDGDGLANGGEYLAALDPLDPDQDDDGVQDGAEVNLHCTEPTKADTDHDGVGDLEEITLGLDGYITSPLRADTDGDGLLDPIEMDLGRDPNVAELSAVSQVSGRVLSGGVGLPQSHVSFQGRGGRRYHVVMTEADGSYSASNLVHGFYYVKAEAPGFADVWYSGAANRVEHRDQAAPLAVPAGALLTGVDFALRRGQSPALVRVDSSPTNAIIYLDYRPTTHRTPATIDVGEVDIAMYETLAGIIVPASHTIWVRKDGHGWPGPKPVAAREAETSQVSFDLHPTNAAGLLVVSTSPQGAQVYVDAGDAALGTTPIIVTNLLAGSHTLILRREGYLQPRPVHVELGQSSNAVVSLAMHTAGTVTGQQVEVVSVPGAAAVFVDYVATSNLTDTTLNTLDRTSFAGDQWWSASHTIHVRKPGFQNPFPRYVEPDVPVAAPKIFYLTAETTNSPDLDFDGLPDAWEASYNLSTASGTGTNGPAGDPDGDGYRNADEMQAGTDPTNPGSYVGMTTAPRPGPGQLLTIRWAAVPQRSYLVQASSSLRAPWVTISGVLTATGGTMSVTDVWPLQASNRFYRAVALPW